MTLHDSTKKVHRSRLAFRPDGFTARPPLPTSTPPRVGVMVIEYGDRGGVGFGPGRRAR